jgi:hypothetical protein
MHNYHDTIGTFPIGVIGIRSPNLVSGNYPLGTSTNNRRTWAFMILPYLEQGATSNAINFNLPYNPPTGAANNTVSELLIAAYLYPSDPNTNQIDQHPHLAISGELRRGRGDRRQFLLIRTSHACSEMGRRGQESTPAGEIRGGVPILSSAGPCGRHRDGTGRRPPPQMRRYHQCERTDVVESRSSK